MEKKTHDVYCQVLLLARAWRLHKLKFPVK